jgi:hypothetical protein
LATIEAQWTQESIATIIVFPLIALVFLGGAVFFFLAWRYYRQEGNHGPFDTPWGWLLVSIICMVAALGTTGGLWWGMYPWKAEYHQWRPVAGVVETIDSRLIAGSKATDQKFVVTYQGNPQQYGVLDTRAASVRKGDRLTITCVKQWQWSGTHGYDCNFVDLVRG